jgi:hypothetical protein
MKWLPWIVAVTLSETGIGCAGATSDPLEMEGEERLQLHALGDDAQVEHGINRHILPFRDPGEPRGLAGTPAARRRVPHLNYFGGPIISNVKIVQVLYGTGSYLSNVASDAAPSLASFYAQATRSAWYSWLLEYNTSSQALGAGSFAESVPITPSIANNGSTISDVSIESELSAQIGSGVLPPPDANTLYMVNFPKGKRINLSGTPSCAAGGFCAYHSTFVRNQIDVYYGVLPDMSAGSGCDRGCGTSTQFNNQTSVASHELAEAVTDPAVGLATTVAPPLAWYDSTFGEIGDICNAQQGTFAGTDAVVYTVQRLWSNASGACILQK